MTARKHTGLAWGSSARDVSSRGVRPDGLSIRPCHSIWRLGVRSTLNRRFISWVILITDGTAVFLCGKLMITMRLTAEALECRERAQS